MNIKKLNSFIFSIGAILIFNCQVAFAIPSEKISHNPVRRIITINREWKFQMGDINGAEKVDYTDSDWQSINLPHSFSIPYFLSPDFYIGYGWYRKHLTFGKKIGDHRFSLEFEGVFQVAEVYVNEISVGKHRGGYNGFSIDISKALRPGDNVIAVRVNNIWDPQLAPRAGEHVFSGGIYRDVRLVETGQVHVAWYGTFVTTPELSAVSGKVNVKTEVSNDGVKAKNGYLKTRILDPSNKVVGSMNSPFFAEAGKTIIVEQTSLGISNPKLWSPANPVLYKTVTTVSIGKKIVDRYKTAFGMRYIEWTAEKGFFLNGKHYYFKGVNVHQDHAGWGDAVTNEGFARDVRMMKEAGFDFIRGSHYPHDPAFSEACDKQGMLYWSENCFWGIGGFKNEGDWSSSAYPTLMKDEKGFENSVKESLTEMIRIHRNHPSIIVWSMCNEPFFSIPGQMPKVRAFLKDLVELSHKLDPTRAVAIGGSQRGDIDKLGDVAGYNGDGAKLYLNPGIPNLVSEYGSTISDRPGEYIPGYGELQDEHFDWRSGQAIWCGFDHGSIAGHFGCMGVVDYFRLPKRQWYWYRNTYNNIPPDDLPKQGIPAAIRLTSDKSIISSADGTDDVHLIATVVDKEGKAITNSPNVTMKIVSGPGEFPTGSSILFQADSDISIRDGKAAIEFRSYYSGKTVIRASSPGLKSDQITIFSKGGPGYPIGKTQMATRPYIRYIAQKDPNKEALISLLAERPSKASSFFPDHSSKLANDQDQTTYWMAKEKLENAWWQVDMENIYNLSQIKLTFPSATNYRYKIEISMDGNFWIPIIDRSQNDSYDKVRIDIPNGNNCGRFLRVAFVGFIIGKPAAIAEIQAFGKHCSK